MKKTVSTVPTLIQQSMQGLAFWIGYQHHLFSKHDLLEGAVVAEFYRLLSRYAEKSEAVLPERAYSSLIVSKAVNKLGRADIVITNQAETLKSSGLKNQKNISNVKYVIEVKRSSAPVATIKADIVRLQNCLNEINGSARGFLIIISQAAKPRNIKNFGSLVNPKGTANLSIPKTIFISSQLSVPIKVRRVCKASSSFNLKMKSSAHYVVLIEVFKK